MPLTRCQENDTPGWKWGEEGKCYTYGPGTDRSEEEARENALAQAAAMGEFEKEVDNSVGDETEQVYEIRKTNDMLNYTLGVVYEPNKLDTDEEFTDEDVIRDAMWKFMESLQGKSELDKMAHRVLNLIIKTAEEGEPVSLDVTKLVENKSIEKRLKDMHTDEVEGGVVVECFQAPVPMEINGEPVKKGGWLLGVVWPDEIFNKILSGERTGYSLGGYGTVVPGMEPEG